MDDFASGIFHDSCEPDGVGSSSEPELLLSLRMTGLTGESRQLSVPGEFEGLATIFVSRLDRVEAFAGKDILVAYPCRGVGQSSLMPCTKYGRNQNY
jgi:hypothetical protein